MLFASAFVYAVIVLASVKMQSVFGLKYLLFASAFVYAVIVLASVKMQSVFGLKYLLRWR